jgi:hypothetical protein
MRTSYIYSFVFALLCWFSNPTSAQTRNLKPLTEYGIPSLELSYSSIPEVENLIVLIDKMATEKDLSGWMVAYLEMKGMVDGQEKTLSIYNGKLTDETLAFLAHFSKNGPHDLFLNRVSVYQQNPPQKEYFEKMVLRILSE